MLACLKRGILEITSRWILFASWANLGEIYILLKLGFWYFYFVALGKSSGLYLHEDIH